MGLFTKNYLAPQLPVSRWLAATLLRVI